MLISGK